MSVTDTRSQDEQAPPDHGTRYRYQGKPYNGRPGCRCPWCRAANTEYARDRRRARS